MVALVLSLMVKHEEEGGDRWFCALILVAVAQQVVGRFVLRTQVVYSLFTSPFGLVNDGRAGQSGPGVELQGVVVGVLGLGLPAIDQHDRALPVDVGLQDEALSAP